MSSAINNLENNAQASGADNSVPIPLSYFIQSVQAEGANQEPKNANQEKTPLNGSASSSQALAQIRQELAQFKADAAAKEARQAAEVCELQARVSAQDKAIADCKGTIRALEAKVRDSALSQTARIDGFERTYRADKIKTARIQQASNKQLEAHLQEMVDAMLNAAVEKAIRLFKRAGRRKPTPAREASTPCLDHLYETRVYR